MHMNINVIEIRLLTWVSVLRSSSVIDFWITFFICRYSLAVDAADLGDVLQEIHWFVWLWALVQRIVYYSVVENIGELTTTPLLRRDYYRRLMSHSIILSCWYDYCWCWQIYDGSILLHWYDYWWSWFDCGHWYDPLVRLLQALILYLTFLAKRIVTLLSKRIGLTFLAKRLTTLVSKRMELQPVYPIHGSFTNARLNYCIHYTCAVR